MHNVILATIVVLLAATAAADDQIGKETIEAFLRTSAFARPSALAAYQKLLAEAEQHLEAAKGGKVVKIGGSIKTEGGKVIYTFQDAERKQEMVDKWTARKTKLADAVSALESGKGFPLYGVGSPMIEVGSFIHDNREVTVDRVIDERTCIVTAEGKKKWWLADFDTTGLEGGKKIRLGDGSGLFIAVKTKNYTTAAGNPRTILEVRRLDLEKAKSAHLKADETFVPYISKAD